MSIFIWFLGDRIAWIRFFIALIFVSFLFFSSTGVSATTGSSTNKSIGTYQSFLSGSSTPTENIADISQAAALSKCKLTKENNPTAAIRCTWKGSKIFSSTPSANSSQTTGSIKIIRSPALLPWFMPEVWDSFIITWKFTGAVQKTSYSCTRNGAVVAGTLNLNATERVQWVYTSSMVGYNSCEWIGYNSVGVEVTKSYEQFKVYEKSI